MHQCRRRIRPVGHWGRGRRYFEDQWQGSVLQDHRQGQIRAMRYASSPLPERAELYARCACRSAPVRGEAATARHLARARDERNASGGGWRSRLGKRSVRATL